MVKVAAAVTAMEKAMLTSSVGSTFTLAAAAAVEDMSAVTVAVAAAAV